MKPLALLTFVVLSPALSALDEKTPAAPESTDARESAGERGLPALFSWADVDGDGRLDLAAVGSAGTLQLLVSTGDGSFEDVTERMGLAGVGNAALALWADYDADGRLDLFVGARCGPSRLFHNEGGQFTDMSAGSGLTSEGAVQSAQWLDHDGDGRLDLFVATAEGSEHCSTLFRGVEGGFFERSELPPLAGAGVVSVPGGPIVVGEPPAPTLTDAPGVEGGVRGRSSIDGSAVSSTGSRAPIVLTPGGGTASTSSMGLVSTCFPSIRDQANPLVCLQASSTPTLGRLYPISANLFVAVGGNVGIGTTTPAARLEVAGTARVTDTLTLAPAGDTALNVSTGSIYKGGTLFIHTKGGGFNTSLGQLALASVTTGFRNTASGYSALRDNTTGFQNTASGVDALQLNTTGDRNTASGYSALRDNTTGNENTASGVDALRRNTTGSRNTASGYAALHFNTTGICNTASGAHALWQNTTGNSNTASGRNALLLNTTGNSNTASGYAALRSNTTGSYNTASGESALRDNTTGYQNTASGRNALLLNTTGNSNTASGYAALRYNTTGFRNTASGESALRFNTTGSRNTASGTSALTFNTTGGGNTASGTDALRSNTTGYRNTASGTDALRSNTTGGRNTASGYRALYSNTTGFQNTASGYAALRSNTTGYWNTASGLGALRSNTTGSRNTASGFYALVSNTTGNRNTASGSFALRYNTTGANNTASGIYTLHFNTTGSANTASGISALHFNTTGGANTASGAETLRSNTTGFRNTASGAYALHYNTTGYRNTASGSRALYSNTTGARNTACGYGALSSSTGIGNIALGFGAGQFLTTGNDNITIGNYGVAGEQTTIRLGTPGAHFRAFIAGIRGTTTGVANAIPVVVDSNGQLGTISSSARFKEEIRDMGELTERLLQLRPVVFRYKPEVQSGERPLEYGLIAEEVAEVFPELVVYDEEGKPFTVKYHLLSSMLLNELKKLREAHERELDELRNRLAVVESRTSALPSAATPADGR